MNKIVKLALILSLMTVINACKKNEITDSNESSIIQVSALKPNANNLISNECIWGDNGATSFYDVERNLAFIGIYNDNYTVGKISDNGNVIWQVNLPYKPRDIKTYSEQIIVIGNKDEDNDNAYDLGYISVFDSNGSLLSELSYNEYSNIEFYDLNDTYFPPEFDDSTEPDINKGANFQKDEFVNIDLYLVGRVQKNGIGYPCIVHAINKDNILQKIDFKVFENMPNQVFCVFKGDYILGNKYTGDFQNTNYTRILVAHSTGITVDPNTAEIVFPINFDIDWSNSFSYDNKLKCTARDFVKVEDNLYIVGKTEYEKSNTSNEYYWHAGFIASYSVEGKLNYIKAINISKHDDFFVHIEEERSSGFSLYASGYCDRYLTKNTKKLFGYGLISKIDPSTGNVVENKMFGDETYRSGFNRLLFRNTNILSFGWTKAFKDHEFNGWFCKILKF